ncbi:hypothetical protein ACFL0V_04315 [Nanoarchaeota archaeon]
MVEPIYVYRILGGQYDRYCAVNPLQKIATNIPLTDITDKVIGQLADIIRLHDGPIRNEEPPEEYHGKVPMPASGERIEVLEFFEMAMLYDFLAND